VYYLDKFNPNGVFIRHKQWDAKQHCSRNRGERALSSKLIPCLGIVQLPHSRVDQSCIHSISTVKIYTCHWHFVVWSVYLLVSCGVCVMPLWPLVSPAASNLEPPLRWMWCRQSCTSIENDLLRRNHLSPVTAGVRFSWGGRPCVLISGCLWCGRGLACIGIV